MVRAHTKASFQVIRILLVDGAESLTHLSLDTIPISTDKGVAMLQLLIKVVDVVSMVIMTVNGEFYTSLYIAQLMSKSVKEQNYTIKVARPFT